MSPADQPVPKVSISERPRARVGSVDWSVAMHSKIHPSTTASGLILAALLAVASPLSSQVPCSPAAESALQQGWRAYRADSLPSAVKSFEQAHHLCPRNLDAEVGLGFARLRQGSLKQADRHFSNVLARDSTSSDAWEGRSRISLRQGDTGAAVDQGRRALALAPDKRDLRLLLDQVGPEWGRGGRANRVRPATLQVASRTSGRGFEVLSAGRWLPFYIQGVNLGVALPGRYPSEFPTDSATYAGWLDTLATMGVNTLRLYTILPPSFYRAVRGWNLTYPGRTLWVMHGVWAELPPKHNFQDPRWVAEFQNEMRRVVDLIYGSASIPPRPGHAAGQYDADVSSWVLGYIIGREWEPFAVKAFDAKNRPGSYLGRYLQVRQAPAMDLWLAQQCDTMLQYEADTYNALHPIAYTSWPTLDPLRHPTEATTKEEATWRNRSGRQSEARKLEYENDAIALDPNLIVPTAQNLAGWFASYHVYPYYPDFMMLDPGYRQARSSEGPSSYFGYLRQLVAHHAAIPTVIAEYGVPSSRGSAHFHPQGWSHGGHDEHTMAAIDARLTREIREAGAAGSIVFAWLDEWFKKNWAVIEYEIPLDNTRLWHNVMDAEQNYGILGQYGGDGISSPRLGGDPGRWRTLPLIQSGPGATPAGPRAIRAGADESYWYIAVELFPGRFAWDSFAIQLAIDTYRPETGQHRLPRSGARSQLGFEFLIELLDPRSASIRVTPDYNRHDSRVDRATGDDFGRFSRRPVTTVNREDGRFDSLYIITNRARFGRDGTFYPARGYDRGLLRYGTQASSSLADWYLDEPAGLLELRIPWDLINVTDPSTRTLLDDRHTNGAFGTAQAVAFHIGVLFYRKAPGGQIIGAVPQMVEGLWPMPSFRAWQWQGWTKPRSHAKLKPVYDSLRLLWQAVPAGGPTPPGRTAPSN